jgi:hypothetical protein
MDHWIIRNLGTDDIPEFGISFDNGQSYFVPDSWIDFLSNTDLDYLLAHFRPLSL